MPRRRKAPAKKSKDPDPEAKQVEAPAPAATKVAAAAPGPDHELAHFSTSRAPYSLRSGMRYIFVLSLLLWWLPTVGQMIAGYVGGRRAGSPWKGIVAALVPVVAIVALAFALENGWLGPWFAGAAAIPALVSGAVHGSVPALAPFVDFLLGYLGAFVEGMKATLSMGTQGYLVTIVFAYVGGIIADQTRREVAAGRGTNVGVSITQPLFAPFAPFFHHGQPVAHADGTSGFEGMQKIAVSGAHARQKPQKVDAEGAHAGAKGLDQGDGPKKPQEEDRPSLADAAATRRFVERALKQYEASHGREA